MQSALSSVEGVTVTNVALPDVAEFTLDTEKASLKDVRKALKKAGYKSSERESEEEA